MFSSLAWNSAREKNTRYLYIFLGTWASTVKDNVSNPNMIALESDQYRWFDFFLFPQKKRDCPEDEKTIVVKDHF